MKKDEVLFAIDHEEYGPKVRETRITTPEERQNNDRIRMIREAMEAADALDPDSKKGKKNRARLELALDDIKVLLELEREWLSTANRFRLGEWVAEDEFITHEEAVQILRFVVERFREDLRQFKIAVVMQKEIMPVLRRGRLGTAAKLPGKMKFLSNVDAVITLDHSRWRMLTDKDRQRLIHHELEHLEVAHTDSGVRKLQLRTHDFEDFASIITVYGLRSESEHFSTDGRSADALEHWSSQLELI